MRLRVFAACVLCRLTHTVLRLLGRGGTALPGKLALRVCPQLLGAVSRGVQVVLVTGTNGKTTTTGMLCAMLDELGLPYFTNRAGANLASGIASEFVAHATLSGRARLPRAVIECDEGALRLVAGPLSPAVIVVTNVFRDQLDRYGEVTHTLASIRAGILTAPESVVCLNADCSLTASLAGDVPNRVCFFGLNEGGCCTGTDVSDAPRCIRCGEAYTYRYRTYAHLGGFVCPRCGYARPEPDVAITHILQADPEGSSAEFSCAGETFPVHVALPSVYNLCNGAAALTAVYALGLDVKTAAGALAGMRAVFGRMETLSLGGQPVRIVLIKNPAGCDRALDYLSSVPGPYLPVFCLNDRIADGTDVSWIWDVDFSRLIDTHTFSRAIVYGTRAGDMRLRLKYAGLPDEDMVCPTGLDELLELLRQSDLPVYILPNYTAMLEVRERIAAESGEKKYWQ